MVTTPTREVRLAPIPIRYDGLDAKDHRIDMALFAESLQGAARLIGVAAHIAYTAEYTNRTPSMAFKIMTKPPEAHCVVVEAILHWAIPALPLVLEMPPADLVGEIVNYILKRAVDGRDDARALELLGDAIQANREAIQANRDVSVQAQVNAQKAVDAQADAVQAMRDVSLAAIAAVQAAARDQRPAVRHFAAPVGLSASQAMIGEPEKAFIVDRSARERIDEEVPEEIRDQQPFTLKVSELDTKTGTCKAEIQGMDPNRRYNCTVADPIVHNPKSPYSIALNENVWLRVSAKPHFQKGEMHRLTIMDTIKS